jgi:hypothetical protein
MSPVANLSYAYQTAPWDSPLSFGVQAFIEYNGLVLNDRHQADRIRVTNITGLDDADISDSREVIPGDDGEAAYDSYYRGRTMVMTGRIEAGSLGNLKRLERDLKAAFAPLVEAPMKFRWFDVKDTFDDPATMQNYTAVIGGSAASSLVPTDGVLRINTTTPVTLLRTADNRLWGDKQVTMRIVSNYGASTGGASTMGLVLAYNSPTNHLYVSASDTVITISIVINGVTYLLSSTPWSYPNVGQSIWLRGRTEGNLVTAEVWLTRPVENALPDYVTATNLQGSDADLLGDQVLTLAGLHTAPSTTNWAVDDFRIDSLAPCDVVFNVKKMPNGMSIKDSQDSLSKFNRQFQITARASQSFAGCATQSRSTAFSPLPLTIPQLDFSFPTPFPLIFATDVAPPGAANTFVTVTNRGTVPVRPLIYVYGAISGFVLANLQNNMQIEWNASLADGDYLIFDCLHRTLVNSQGQNMMASFSSNSSRWMQLEPAQNDIYLAGSNYSPNTKMAIYWRHGLV